MFSDDVTQVESLHQTRRMTDTLKNRRALMANEKRLLDVVTDVILDCQELSGDDQLFVLQLAWWTAASNIRNAQVEAPKGFSAARQAAMLESMADWVRGDTSDPELERLWQEADHAALVNHLRHVHA